MDICWGKGKRCRTGRRYQPKCNKRRPRTIFSHRINANFGRKICGTQLADIPAKKRAAAQRAKCDGIDTGRRMKGFSIELWTMREGKIAIWEAAFNSAPADQSMTTDQVLGGLPK